MKSIKKPSKKGMHQKIQNLSVTDWQTLKFPNYKRKPPAIGIIIKPVDGAITAGEANIVKSSDC